MINMKPTVGSVYELKLNCLGNPSGTLGVCYEVYELGDHTGYSFIFQNGNYDGFGEDEVDEFLKYAAFDHSMKDYQFTNVMQLSNDFRDGKLGFVSKARNSHVIYEYLQIRGIGK